VWPAGLTRPLPVRVLSSSAKYGESSALAAHIRNRRDTIPLQLTPNPAQKEVCGSGAPVDSAF
jgi:hypothetical protein